MPIKACKIEETASPLPQFISKDHRLALQLRRIHILTPQNTSKTPFNHTLLRV